MTSRVLTGPREGLRPSNLLVTSVLKITDNRYAEIVYRVENTGLKVNKTVETSEWFGHRQLDLSLKMEQIRGH